MDIYNTISYDGALQLEVKGTKDSPEQQFLVQTLKSGIFGEQNTADNCEVSFLVDV